MSSFISPASTTSKSDNLKALLTGRSIRTKSAMIEMQQSGIRAMWQNKTLTPQQVCDAYGSEAASLFTFHGILTDALVGMQTAERALQATEETPVDYGLLWPAKTWTVNNDGTVTIGEADWTPPTP